MRYFIHLFIHDSTGPNQIKSVTPVWAEKWIPQLMLLVFLLSPEGPFSAPQKTLPMTLKLQRLRLCDVTRLPEDSSQERKLKLLAGGKIWNPLWVSDIIPFYYVFHFPVEESKIWEGMPAVLNSGARHAGGKGPLQAPPSLATPPPRDCAFSEPGLLMHQRGGGGGGRGCSINTDVMTSVSSPQPR